MITYSLTDIPDPQFPRYQVLANGNVRDEAWRDCDNLLYMFSHWYSGAMTATLQFFFTPIRDRRESQSRLRIHLIVRPYDESVAESMSLLLQQGPLNRFFNMKRDNVPDIPWGKLKVAYSILRRDETITPLHTPEFNERIPLKYYTIQSLNPNLQNDYRILDNVLNQIQEKVLIQIAIEPVDISNERLCFMRYLARLQSINRSWDQSEVDIPRDVDYLAYSEPGTSAYRSRRKPLRYFDPFANDLLRSQQRFHETLQLPHFLFHILILAESEAVAYTLTTIMAESAFRNGNYQFQRCEKSEALFDQVLQCIKENRISTHLGEKEFNGNQYPEIYWGLNRLGYLAPVSELSGAFRFPVANYASPYCIRKNTDPPKQINKHSILLGYDDELSADKITQIEHGFPRAVDLETLAKHVFITGMSGSGKTTEIQNILIQLHSISRE